MKMLRNKFPAIVELIVFMGIVAVFALKVSEYFNIKVMSLIGLW